MQRDLLFVMLGSMLLGLSATGLAQGNCTHPATRTWLHLSNREGFATTLWFGFDSTATYSIDAHLCEFELPPIPPYCPWWHPMFTNIPGREGTSPPVGLGLGTWFDYRRFTSPQQVDTHKVRFWSADSLCGSGHPTIIRWSREELLSIADSTVMTDEFGGILHRVRMDDVDSLVVTHAAINSLLIYRYGARIGTADVGSSSQEPHTSTLFQNYPNPFNPSTEIVYTVGSRESVGLRVYDVLGREVAVLVDEVKEPGTHRVQWNADGLSTGMYFYTLKAGAFVQTRKLMIIR